MSPGLPRRQALVLALAVALATAACPRHAAPLRPIGSPCRTDAECGSGTHCATDHPGGYCEAPCAWHLPCPDGEVCVGAGVLATGACHQPCTHPGDCRAGYLCVQPIDEARRMYCDPPGRSDLARRVRGGAWLW